MANTVKVQDVTPGSVIREYGHTWTVKRNVFDPKGNTGNQPRHILICDCLDDDGPKGCMRDMTFGKLVDAEVVLY